MGKLAIGILICSLCMRHAEAQQLNDIKLSRERIQGEVKTILKNSLDSTCRKTIVSFQGKLKYLSNDSLTIAHSNELNERAVKKFISYGKRFASTEYKNCDSTAINHLRRSAESIVKELEHLLKLPKPKNKLSDTLTISSHKPTIELSIRVVDSKSDSHLGSQIRIYKIDSTLTNDGTKTDSTGYLHLALLPGKYWVRVAADDHQPLDSVLIISGKSQDLVFHLNPKTAERPSDSPVRSSFDLMLRGFVREDPVWAAVVSFVFVLISVSAVLHITAYTKNLFFAIPFHTLTDPENSLVKNEEVMNPVNTNLEILQSPLLSMKEELETKPVGSDEVTVGETPPHRYFLCEIMMTAGPRKKFMNEPNADKDLGEDVCGMICNSSEALMWLLDGTSDLHSMRSRSDRREYFSSRLLAQSLANEFRQAFTEKAGKPIEEMITQSIEKVKSNWLAVIKQLPEEEKLVIRDNILNKNFPECASTLLLGQLSINGDFTAYRSGDSKMLLFLSSSQNEIKLIDTSLATKNEACNDRIFFRLCFDKKNELDIQANQPKYELITNKNIHTMIAFSDGVGILTEELLKNGFEKQPNQMREQIIYQLQGTEDDKSICFITIKENK